MPLNSAQVFGWSAAIDQNDGTATTDTPPKNIIEIAQSTAAKGKRAAAKAMTELSPSLKASASSGSDFDRLVNLMALGELKQQQKQQRREQKIEEQEEEKEMNKINQKTKLGKPNKLGRPNKLGKPPSSEQSLAMRSSSPVEGDDLLEYVQWHILQKEKRRGAFMTAYIKLNARGYDLQTLQSWKNKSEAHWENMHIQPGIGIQLARDVSKYGTWRLQRSLRVGSTTRTMPVSQSQIETQNQTQK